MTAKIHATNEPPIGDLARLDVAKRDAEYFLEMMAEASTNDRDERDYGRVVYMLLFMLRTVHRLADPGARDIMETQVRTLLGSLYEAP